MHQSIPAVPIPPPGNRGAFAHVVGSPGGGASANFIAAWGLGISIPRRRPLGICGHTCFQKIDEFIGKDEAFVKDCLVRQGLEKPADVFKGLFSQF